MGTIAEPSGLRGDHSETGMVWRRAVWIGIGIDDLMRSSKGQEGSAVRTLLRTAALLSQLDRVVEREER